MMPIDLADIFDKVSKKMQADIEEARSAVEHSGTKGDIFERIVRKHLRQYLPKSLDVSTGMLVDYEGNVSKQLDVIISDAMKTPIFYCDGDVRVIPVECANAVIEVKSSLDSNRIDNIIENMLSVRSLKKWPYLGQGHTSMYGKDDWEAWPINYFVFAFDSIDLKTLGKYIDTKHKTMSLPEYKRIDTVCVLNKGVIANKSKDGPFDALPTPGSQLYVWETKDALLLFYQLASTYFFNMRFPTVPIPPYIKTRFPEGYKIE